MNIDDIAINSEIKEEVAVKPVKPSSLIIKRNLHKDFTSSSRKRLAKSATKVVRKYKIK